MQRLLAEDLIHLSLQLGDLFANSSGLIRLCNRKLKEVCVLAPFRGSFKTNYAGKFNLRPALGNRKCSNDKCCAYAPCFWCWGGRQLNKYLNCV